MPFVLKFWPINEKASQLPQRWEGWPEKKQFAFILTHDIETRKGYDLCLDLAKIDVKFGFRSSFCFVPERYRVDKNLLASLKKMGLEVAVHGLKHDGRLFNSQKIFGRRAKKINQYLRNWESVGFYSPSMHRNTEMMHELDMIYSQSTFDIDPFEPQPNGVNTIFPFFVANKKSEHRYVELPYTLPQDHTLFVVLGETDITYWKKKIDWIAEKGGMVLLKTHPDYMDFRGVGKKMKTYPVQYYSELLEYVKEKYQGSFWHVLPFEVVRFWYSRDSQNG